MLNYNKVEIIEFVKGEKFDLNDYLSQLFTANPQR